MCCVIKRVAGCFFKAKRWVRPSPHTSRSIGTSIRYKFGEPIVPNTFKRRKNAFGVQGLETSGYLGVHHGTLHTVTVADAKFGHIAHSLVEVDSARSYSHRVVTRYPPLPQQRTRSTIPNVRSNHRRLDNAWWLDEWNERHDQGCIRAYRPHRT